MTRIADLVQAFQNATDEVDDAVSARLGLNRTDLRCLSVLARSGPAAPSVLAAAAGLTRGAITTALDRLEDGGYTKRTADPQDRRGLRIELTSGPSRRSANLRTDGERRRRSCAGTHARNSPRS